MSHSVSLHNEILHRYIGDMSLSNTKKVLGIAKNTKVQCIIDTACINTLIPLRYTRVCGVALNKTAEITVGGHSYTATAFKFANVSFGGINIPKLIAFAAEYKGSLSNRILLGLNFLNNLKFTISRAENTMTFEQSFIPSIADKKYPFTVYFEQPDLKPVYPSLLVEGDEIKPMSFTDMIKNKK